MVYNQYLLIDLRKEIIYYFLMQNIMFLLDSFKKCIFL